MKPFGGSFQAPDRKKEQEGSCTGPNQEPAHTHSLAAGTDGFQISEETYVASSDNAHSLRESTPPIRGQ